MKKFSDFGIDERILNGLIDSNHYRPTKIQIDVMNNLGSNQNTVLMSPAGTGKTCAFCITVLQRIINKYTDKNNNITIKDQHNLPLAIIVAPTSELVKQIESEFRKISRNLPLLIAGIEGSSKLDDIWQDLKSIHILIITPGVLNKYTKKKSIKFYRVLTIVVDEWDKMLSDKFLSVEIEKFFKNKFPNLQQVIVSSATCNKDAYSKLVNIFPAEWKIFSSDVQENIIMPHHYLKRIGSFENRIKFTINLLRNLNFQQALIFCNIRDLANACNDALNACGFPSFYISSQIDQSQRIDIIEEFRDMEYRCLVTTDLVSRGLDVSTVNVVINLDMAHDPETFKHRVGRVGRFGTDGLTVTLLKRSECRMIPELKKITELKLESFSESSKYELELPPIRNEDRLRNFKKLLEAQEAGKDNEIVFELHETGEEDENDDGSISELYENDKTDENQILDISQETIAIHGFSSQAIAPHHTMMNFFSDDYWRIYSNQCKQNAPPYMKL